MQKMLIEANKLPPSEILSQTQSAASSDPRTRKHFIRMKQIKTESIVRNLLRLQVCKI